MLAATAPHSVFRAACKELCTRIWIELELLAQGAWQFEGQQDPDLEMSAAILRLELVVLVDFSRSAYGRSLLSAAQRDRLCSMLTDVLAALYVDLEHLRGGVAEAQERIFDELMAEPEATPSETDSNFESENHLGQGMDPAVGELMSLVEAQAAAHAQRQTLLTV
jgi:hypothetical protein